MTSSPTLFTFGTVGGTPVQGDITGGLYTNQNVLVQLTASYVMDGRPNVLTRPFQGGAPISVQALPQTFASGTQLLLHPPEAYALIGAGYATLVAVE